MKDSYYMQLAISKAEEGVNKGQSPFGSVIVKNGEIVSCEHNHVWETNDPTAHAEIVAIRYAAQKLKDIDLSDCTIYTTCEPCPMCFAAIHWARIPRIIYGVRIEDVKKLGFNEIPVSNTELNRTWSAGIEITESFMREENLELLELWQQLNDNPY